MSLNVPSVDVARVMDPRLEINRKRDYVALKGALVNTHQQFPATNVNNSSIQITCNPPNRGIVVSRLIYKRVVFDVTITGTNTGAGPLLNPGFFGPRFMPLLQVTSSEQMTINNDTLTQAPVNQYWPEIMRYHNEFKNRFGQLSLCPSMMDQHQSYEDGAGGVRNPLGGYDDNSYEQTRGSFAGMEVLSNPDGGTTATLRITTTEPILISPLVAGCHSNYTAGLSGIQNMAYTATIGNLTRVMSLVADQGAPGVIDIQSSGVNVNLSQASLLFNYLTPDPLNPVPRNLVSSYFSIVSYPTKTSAPIAPGNEVSITMQSVQVTSIPRRIYVFARRDDSQKTAFTSDSLMALPQTGNPITLTWNNNQFLSQMTTQDIYNTSVKNSCNLSYSQFVDKVGAVQCYDFGTDIGLMSDEAPGCLGNYQLGLTCRFKNTGSEDIAPTLFVVVVYEGTFNVDDGNCSHMIGVLSREDVLNSRRVPGVSYQQAQDVFGGNFFTKIKNAFQSVGRFAKQHKLLSKGLSLIPDPRAQAAAKLAQSVGLGMSGGSLKNDDIIKKIQYNASSFADDYSDEDCYEEYPY